MVSAKGLTTITSNIGENISKGSRRIASVDSGISNISGRIGRIGGYDIIDESRIVRKASKNLDETGDIIETGTVSRKSSNVTDTTFVETPKIKNVQTQLQTEGIPISNKETDAVNSLAKGEAPSPAIKKGAEDIKKTFGQNLKDLSFDDVKTFLKENRYTLGATALLSTVTIISIVAQAKTDKINSTGYTITSIKKDPRNSKYVNITYEPRDVLTKDDTVTITGSNTAPSIDNVYRGSVINPVGGAFTLKLQNPITMDGTSGSFTVITEFGSQFANEVTNVTQPVVEAGGEVVSGAVGTVAETAVSSFGDIIDAILPGFGEYAWLVIILCILILSSSASLVFGLYVRKTIR